MENGETSRRQPVREHSFARPVGSSAGRSPAVPYAGEPPTAEVPRDARFAEIAMVAGVFSMATAFAPGGLFAIVIGWLALRSPMPHNRATASRAFTGISCGFAGLLLMPLLLTFALAPRVIIGSLPILADARQESRRMADLAALQRIGAACLIYAANHDGAYPPTLLVLRDAGLVAPEDLESRSAGDRKRVCDYFYVAGLRLDDPPHWIVAYGDPKQAASRGVFTLRSDGASEHLDAKAWKAAWQRFNTDFRQARGSDLKIVLPVTAQNADSEERKAK